VLSGTATIAAAVHESLRPWMSDICEGKGSSSKHTPHGPSLCIRVTGANIRPFPPSIDSCNFVSLCLSCRKDFMSRMTYPVMISHLTWRRDLSGIPSQEWHTYMHAGLQGRGKLLPFTTGRWKRDGEKGVETIGMTRMQIPSLIPRSDGLFFFSFSLSFP